MLEKYELEVGLSTNPDAGMGLFTTKQVRARTKYPLKGPGAKTSFGLWCFSTCTCCAAAQPRPFFRELRLSIELLPGLAQDVRTHRENCWPQLDKVDGHDGPVRLCQPLRVCGLGTEWALIIRIGFWGPPYYQYSKEPP